MELYSYLISNVSETNDPKIIKWVQALKSLEFSLNIYHNLVYKKSKKLMEEKEIMQKEIDYERRNFGKENKIIEEIK